MKPRATKHSDRVPTFLPRPLRLCALCLLLCAACRKAEPQPAPSSPPESPAGPAVITTKSNIEMALIPAGDFAMGDENGLDDEKPVRQVHVDSFYIDRQEVTQESFQAMMGKNPAKAVGPGKPVERVSWVWAVQYCNMRSLREGLRPCYDAQTLARDRAADGYRLPTEAEWEYACRAGSTTRWSCGDDPQQVTRCGWLKTNAANTTHPVRQKEPNAWGLYDMHGNVAEWCEDYYAEAYDPRQTSNPRGPDSGDERVLRGGSWKTSDDACRSAARYSQPPGLADVCFGYDAYGFRCVRDAAPHGQPASDAAEKTTAPQTASPPPNSAGAEK